MENPFNLSQEKLITLVSTSIKWPDSPQEEKDYALIKLYKLAHHG